MAATRALLVEVGYSGLRVADVAARAGTTKAALYRRWPSVTHLVYEATFPDQTSLAMQLDGDIRADLHRLIVGTRDALCSPVVAAALPGLLAEFATHPELHTALFGRFAGVLSDIDQRLRRAVEAGEVTADVRADELVTTVAGAVLSGLLLAPQHLDDAWADRLSAILWRGIRS